MKVTITGFVHYKKREEYEDPRSDFLVYPCNMSEYGYALVGERSFQVCWLPWAGLLRVCFC